jgi:hypothetical protein
MSFVIYPNLERSCPNVNHCPHLGGASVVSVARVANRSEETEEDCLRQIRVLEEINSRLLSDVVALQKELEQTKLELRLERQNKFATNKQKNDPDEPGAETNPEEPNCPKKRGAPVGHPGWFRETPVR